MKNCFSGCLDYVGSWQMVLQLTACDRGGQMQMAERIKSQERCQIIDNTNTVVLVLKNTAALVNSQKGVQEKTISYLLISSVACIKSQVEVYTLVCGPRSKK